MRRIVWGLLGAMILGGWHVSRAEFARADASSDREISLERVNGQTAHSVPAQPGPG